MAIVYEPSSAQPQRLSCGCDEKQSSYLDESLGSHSVLSIKWPYMVGLVALLVVGLTSCNNAQSLPDALPTPLPAIPVEGTPNFFGQEEVDIPDTTDRQLVLWVPASINRLVDLGANRTLASIYEQFERNHPGVHIEAQIHAESGEASLLSYLRSAQRVAPAILPDLILIDTQQLWQVADFELLQPLDRQQFSRNFEFYPFAINAVTYQEQLVGVPYLAELTHMVAHSGEMPTMPRTWEEFYTIGEPLFFAAGKSEIFNEFTYQQYFGAGGQVLETQPLDSDALLAFFTFLADAQDQNLILDAVLGITNSNAVWDAFIAEDRGVAVTSTHAILEHWDAFNNEAMQYGPLFGRNNVTTPSARIWAFVVIANDPQQQELSLALLQALLSPEIHSQWSRVAMQIPTQPSAFELWRSSIAYHGFLEQQLAVAYTFPSSRRFADLNRRLQYGQEFVLRKEMTPEEAAIYVQATP